MAFLPNQRKVKAFPLHGHRLPSLSRTKTMDRI